MKEFDFRGKRVDNGEWVYGYHFKTPLTFEMDAESESGLHFLSGKERHCISDEHGCVYEVVPQSIERWVWRPRLGRKEEEE